MDAARALHKADPKVFITNDTGDTGATTSLIWQAGGRPYRTDGTNITVDFGDEGTGKYTATWQKLLADKLLAPVSSWSDAWYEGLADGSVVPVVRKPVADLGDGRPLKVLGMADALVTNDPVTGQGSNNAAHCAARHLRAVVEHGDAPFDESWMHSTYAPFWDHVRHTVDFTNTMLADPLPDHVQQVMAAAADRTP